MTSIETLQRNVNELWRKACKYDGLDPTISFVTFSKSNPYTKAYDQMMTQLQRMKGART